MATSREFLEQQVKGTPLPASAPSNAPVVGPNNQEYMPPTGGPPSAKDMGRFALEAGGSIALPLLMPEIGLPLQAARLLGPTVSRILPKIFEAGGGAGAGSLAAETFDPTKTDYERTGDPTQFGVPPDPMGQALGQAKRAAAVGMLGEAGGQVLGKTAQWFGTPKTQPGVTQAQRLLGPKGAGLTSGQATKSGLVDTIEGLSESGFWPTRTSRMKVSGEQAANDLVQDLLQSYSAFASERGGGEAIQQAIKSRIGTWKGMGQQMYAQVDRLAGQKAIPVDIAPIQQEAARLADESFLKNPTSAALLKDILSKPRHVSFSDAQRFRSELLAVGGDPTEIVKGRRENFARLLAHQLDSVMETSADRLNPAAKVAWRNANAWWKGDSNIVGAQVLKDPVIIKIMENDPGVVLDTLLKSGKLEGFQAATKLLPPSVLDGVRHDFLKRAVINATEDISGQATQKLTGASLSKTMGVSNPYSKESAAMRGLFDPKQVDNIGDIIQTLRLTQTVPRSQAFMFVARGLQTGAALSIAKGGWGWTLTATPDALAILINNPASQRLLIHGINTLQRGGIPEATAAIMKIAAFAERNGIPVNGEASTYLPEFAQRSMEGFKTHPRYQQGLPATPSQPTPTLPLP